MARYVTAPGITSTSIQEIASIDKRYNTRCLYTTPGNYTFTVPSGVCEILAVAVGSGSAPCTLLNCVDVFMRGSLCGCIYECNFQCACYWASCCRTDLGVRPTLIYRNLYTQLTTRPLCITGTSCVYCDGSNPYCYCWTCVPITGNQMCYYVTQVVGSGGGYAEKVIATAPGTTYCVVVSDNCVGNFSCVEGHICATGPKVCRSTCPTIIGPLVDGCCFTDKILNAACTTQYCVGSFECCCIRYRCCAVTTTIQFKNSFNTCVVPGCGFGGDINRVGGFSQSDYSGTFNSTGADVNDLCYATCICQGALCVGSPAGCIKCLSFCILCCTPYEPCCITAYETHINCGLFCDPTCASLYGYQFLTYSPLAAATHMNRCFNDSMYGMSGTNGCMAVRYCVDECLRITHRTVGYNQLGSFCGTHATGDQDMFCSCMGAYAPLWCCCSCCYKGVFCVRKDTGVTDSYNLGCNGSCTCLFEDGSYYVKINSNIVCPENMKFGGSSAGNYYSNGVSTLSDATYTKCVMPRTGCDGTLCCYYCSRTFNCSLWNKTECNWCRACGSYRLPFTPCYYCVCISGTPSGCTCPCVSCTDYFRFSNSVYQCNNCPGTYVWEYPSLCTNNFAIDNNLYFTYPVVSPLAGGMGLSNPQDHLSGHFSHSILTGKVFNGTCFGCCGPTSPTSGNCMIYCNVWGCNSCDRSGDVVYNCNCACYKYYSECEIKPGQNPIAIACGSGCAADRIPFTMTGLPDIVRWCSNGTICPAIFCIFAINCGCVWHQASCMCYAINFCGCTCSRCGCISGWSDYWPICVGYNYVTATCKNVNNNPLYNIYEIFCGLFHESAQDNETCLCHPFNSRILKYEMLGSIGSDERLWSAMMCGTKYDNSATGCCVFKSPDKVQLCDPTYYDHFVHDFFYSDGFYKSHRECTGCAQYGYKQCSFGVEYNKYRYTYRDGACYDITQVQGGAGTAKAGTWNSCVAASSTSTSSGGYLKCVLVTCGGRCFTECPYLCVTGGGGQGAIVRPIMSFACFYCSTWGFEQKAGGCIAGIEVVCAGSGYTSNPTITVYGGGGGCYCCFNTGTPTDRGCVVLEACAVPLAGGASSYHISYGSGGGTVSGVDNNPIDVSIIDSSAIQSVKPGRGGRGCEPQYEPFYYAYPGIAAKITTRPDPSTYVGDKVTGCSWFDTKQIKGSGGNGCFISPTFSYIHAQDGGPGGGGAVGTFSDGTLAGQGGVLAGGGGCCGTGGYGGGGGWCGTPGTGMVVIYWDS